MNLIYIKIFINRLQFSVINYIDHERNELKNEEIIIPTSFSIGDKLNYIKRIINSIIEQYEIVYYNIDLDNEIGVKIIESVKIEGVLEELFSCKGVELWK